MNDLMARNGIDRNFRVSRLADVIRSPDLNLAIKGLDQSWRLEGSYAADKVEHSIGSPDEIRAWIQRVQPDDTLSIIDITSTV
jgi:hypothetical protein